MKYTLLVNTCDGFEDCWEPFFKLLKKYWLAPLPPVLLNTEKKEWGYPGVDLRCAKVQKDDIRLTWSQCLIAALDQIETEYVLYMQEDYFIESDVDCAEISRIIDLLDANPEIAHVGLTFFGPGGRKKTSPYAGLWRVGRFAPYRLSTQAALWRVKDLKKYAREWENGWMFELYGTVRAWRKNDFFLVIDPARKDPVIRYGHTGIIKGKWASFVTALFKKEDLSVDLTVRGFYDDTQPALVRRVNLLRLILKKPLVGIKSILS